MTDVTMPPCVGDAAPLSTERAREGALTLAAILVAAFLLALPALWNGFPLLYWDSADYIEMPFTGKVPVWRTASYVLMTSFGVMAGTLWAVIAVQCLLVAYLLHEVLAAFAPIRARVALVPTTAALCLLTGLPWFSSQLMADTFTGVLLLGMAALAFGPEELGRTRRLALALALALAMAVHTTHIALGGGLVLSLILLRGVGWLGLWRWMTPRVTMPAAVVAMGVTLAVGANWTLTGQAFVSQSTGNLMLARIVQDGIARKYLNAVCPRGATLRMCAVRNRLPGSANAFLWFPGPFYEIGGWTQPVQKEAERIVADSLRLFPWEHVESAVNLTVEQLGLVASGDGLVKLDTIHASDLVENDPFMPRVLAAYFPGDLADYWTSRQRHGIDLTMLNQLHVPLALAAYGAIVVMLLAGLRHRDRLVAGLALAVVLGLLGNAFICGALSNPNARYQARITWAAVLAVGLCSARLLQQRRDDGVPA